MGYYTCFYLYIHGITDKALRKSTLKNIIRDMKIISEYDDFLQNPPYLGNHKWYSDEYDKTFLKLSKKYKNYMFQLQGFGEVTGDAWETRYFQGSMEDVEAHFEYPPFKQILKENFYEITIT